MEIHQMTVAELARHIAARIKADIEVATKDGKVSKSTITTSYALHISMEATARALEVDPAWFKKECGVGQPLAYFV